MVQYDFRFVKLSQDNQIANVLEFLGLTSDVVAIVNRHGSGAVLRDLQVTVSEIEGVGVLRFEVTGNVQCAPAAELTRDGSSIFQSD